MTLAVEHVADSWDVVHFCGVNHDMTLINLIQTTYIKEKNKTQVIDHMPYDGLHVHTCSKSSRTYYTKYMYRFHYEKQINMFSFTEKSAPRQELFP